MSCSNIFRIRFDEEVPFRTKRTRFGPRRRGRMRVNEMEMEMETEGGKERWRGGKEGEGVE